MSIYAHLPEGLNNAFEISSKALFLEPGQQINDFNELPPGLIFIKSGEVRLIYKDSYDEQFTISLYKILSLVAIILPQVSSGIFSNCEYTNSLHLCAPP